MRDPHPHRCLDIEGDWVPCPDHLCEADALQARLATVEAALRELYESVISSWNEDDIYEDSSYAQHGGVVRADLLARVRAALASEAAAETPDPLAPENLTRSTHTEHVWRTEYGRPVACVVCGARYDVARPEKET